ncbi:MAG: CDP-alcohol phosphatidyltransferase family protein [Ruminococcaceae bacterium]|nr:CDP-alcohol phosphatidyltransferase family protein [Oscillospiraceae bacterium]
MSDNDRKDIERAQRADTDRILTLPNILSFFRLLLIPIIVILYENGHSFWALSVLFLSGVTDVVDGWIARTFHLVSDFGKAIDPVADKLTQLVVLLCLLDMKYWWVVAALVAKEFIIGIMTLMALHKTHSVYSAGWYGKLCTMVIYLSMGIMILWEVITGNPIPETFVLIDSILIVSLILLSFAKYFIYFAKILKEAHNMRKAS